MWPLGAGLGKAMDGFNFDRLTRALRNSLTRRGFFAGAVGFAAGIHHQITRATQLGPSTCGAQGAVCTHLAGCCAGLTCGTSAINTNYGVCVPGTADMTITGTSLISPHSETVVEEVTALVQTAATSTTTVDLQAERDARIAEIQTRKDAKQTKRQTRRTDQKTTRETRNDTQQSRRIAGREAAVDDAEDAATAAKTALGPRLQLELFTDGTTQVAEGEPEVPVETVKVTNRGDVRVKMTRIESILSPGDFSSLTTTQFDLDPGESYLFYSGVNIDATSTEFGWLDKFVCSVDDIGDGFLIKAAFSSNAANHDFTILCDGPRITALPELPVVTPAPVVVTKKKNDDKNDKKKGNDNRPRQKSKRKKR